MEANNHMEEKKSWVKRGWWLILLVIAGLIAPQIISEFYLLILGEALIMSLFALSFNLLFGYMGQLPFGQAAFYGLGGYGMAMLLTKFQVNFWLSFMAGIGIAALIGLDCRSFLCPASGDLFFHPDPGLWSVDLCGHL